MEEAKKGLRSIRGRSLVACIVILVLSIVSATSNDWSHYISPDSSNGWVSCQGIWESCNCNDMTGEVKSYSDDCNTRRKNMFMSIQAFSVLSLLSIAISLPFLYSGSFNLILFVVMGFGNLSLILSFAIYAGYYDNKVCPDMDKSSDVKDFLALGYGFIARVCESGIWTILLIVALVKPATKHHIIGHIGLIVFLSCCASTAVDAWVWSKGLLDLISDDKFFTTYGIWKGCSCKVASSDACSETVSLMKSAQTFATIQIISCFLLSLSYTSLLFNLTGKKGKLILASVGAGMTLLSGAIYAGYVNNKHCDKDVVPSTLGWGFYMKCAELLLLSTMVLLIIVKGGGEEDSSKVPVAEDTKQQTLIANEKA
eukprot:PhF_6_TR17422/c0_g1_i2/m.26663